jgi:hypothetical protein
LGLPPCLGVAKRNGAAWSVGILPAKIFAAPPTFFRLPGATKSATRFGPPSCVTVRFWKEVPAFPNDI